MKSDELDKILSERKFEEASPDLAARIIAQAHPKELVAVRSWGELLRMWLTPKALVAVTLVFVVGLAVGRFTPFDENGAIATDLSDYLYYEELIPWQTN